MTMATPRDIPPDKILDFLFLGNLFNASRKQLADLGVSYVLSLRRSGTAPPPGVKYCHCPLEDNGETNLFDIFEMCFNHISAAKAEHKNILVHCDGGINRAPTIVAGYLVAREKWTLKKAFEHVKSKRPQIAPRKSYFEQLQKLEFQTRGDISIHSYEELGKSLEQRREDARMQARMKTSGAGPGLLKKGGSAIAGSSGSDQMSNLLHFAKQAKLQRGGSAIVGSTGQLGSPFAHGESNSHGHKILPDQVTTNKTVDTSSSSSSTSSKNKSKTKQIDQATPISIDMDQSYDGTDLSKERSEENGVRPHDLNNNNCEKQDLTSTPERSSPARHPSKEKQKKPEKGKLSSSTGDEHNSTCDNGILGKEKEKHPEGKRLKLRITSTKSKDDGMSGSRDSEEQDGQLPLLKHDTSSASKTSDEKVTHSSPEKSTKKVKKT